MRARLFELASAFRAAIEGADRSALVFPFDQFPDGCCGDTAQMLGHFLIAHDIRDVRYMSGERGQPGNDWKSHAWLRVDGFIVDITADQFPEMDEPVIVAANSPWHGTFTVKDEGGDNTSIADLGDIYIAIMKALDPALRPS